MLAPILFGSGPSGTSNSSSSSSSNAGSTSSSGSSTSGSTSSPSTSETPESTYQEPDTTEAGDVDDGTYQPTPAEDPTAEQPEASATGTDGGSETVTEDAEPVAADGDSDTAPDGAEQSTGTNTGVAANDTDSGSEAQGDDMADTVPPAGQANQASVAGSEDDIEAAALAAYRGEPVAQQSKNSVFRERLTALVDQSLNRGRDRALEVSQARIIAGLLSGADDQEASTKASFALDQQRQTADVVGVVRVYQQA